MIFDRIKRLPFYGPQIPGAEQIAAAFSAASPQTAPCEVREKSYALREDAKRRYEVHFQTIDLMMAWKGAETIHICPVEPLKPAEALPNGADGRKLDGEPQGTAVLLEAGYFCAIFPGEAHMVGGKIGGEEGFISKWVVKVPASEVFRVTP